MNADTLPLQVPDLVLNIAKELNGRSIASEAAMYNYLLPLQGVVIPRCYGYFGTQVDLTQTVVRPWDPSVKYPKVLDDYLIPSSRASFDALLLERVGKCSVEGMDSGRDEAFKREFLAMGKDLRAFGAIWGHTSRHALPQYPSCARISSRSPQPAVAA
ncbi:hypothetical protein C8Q80DRAFT_1192586 [Daedaleopsis nitida]|nr:hypothetical protein C8Q80DRAFT_1192586 [Daedaleopsis nitida]